MGVESLETSGAPRLRCLDVFLVVSTVFLFMALAVVTVGFWLLAPALSRGETGGLSRHQSDNSDVYNMQNFAYLEAKTSALGNGPMEWSPVSYGAGGSVGSNFVFHAEQRALELKRDGSYFLYVDLQLICTTECDATGPVTVSIGKDFTCTVELPKRSGSSGPLSHKCWEVVRMTAGTRLIATMTVPESSPKQWMLDVKKSGQGIFLVD